MKIKRATRNVTGKMLSRISPGIVSVSAGPGVLEDGSSLQTLASIWFARALFFFQRCLMGLMITMTPQQ